MGCDVTYACCVAGPSQCSKLKRQADGEVGEGRLQPALSLYGQALQLLPSFVSCLSNRAAAHLALGDARACEEDCSMALECLEGGEQGPLSGVPPVGSEKRRAWVLRTLARRGAARAAMGQVEGARQDLSTALALAPHGSEEAEELAADLKSLEQRQPGRDEAVGPVGPED